MKKNSTVTISEKEKFAQLSNDWWDADGPLKTLHDINAVRESFVLQHTSLQDLHVLDLGCGGGIFTEALARQGAVIDGLDVEPGALKAASDHAKKENLSINYVCSAVEDYKAKSYDVICCMEMLEHVEQPQAIIHHCQRLLKPGGMLFLSTINRTLKAYSTAIVLAEYVLSLLPRQTHDYDKFITPAELATALRNESFDAVSLKGMSYNPLTRAANLTQDVSINYLMAARKSIN
jgi:2-polyprenyl-6-hydroxyphenyl methylase/3-demethylubiquinone-9 3-methyltransferase